MAPPQNGHELIIPLFNAESLGTPSTVTWSQNWSTRKADYYALKARNVTTNEESPIFIAVELYGNPSTNAKHVTRIGQLVEGEGYKLKIDSNMQYGQKNAQGDLRFIVYHDKERKPYQHRFVETALGSLVAPTAKAVATLLGAGPLASTANDAAKNFIGDYLRDF